MHLDDVSPGFIPDRLNMTVPGWLSFPRTTVPAAKLLAPFDVVALKAAREPPTTRTLMSAIEPPMARARAAHAVSRRCGRSSSRSSTGVSTMGEPSLSPTAVAGDIEAGGG